MAANIEGLIKRFEVLFSDRANFNSLWEDIAKFMYPQRESFVSQPVPGEQFLKNVYDSTAIIANERLASALHGMLTSPASKWFIIKVADNNLNEVDEVKIWLQDVENKMLEAMNSPRANFSSAMHEIYMEYCAFGTAILFVGLNNDKNGLLFQARPLAETYLAENSENKVDTSFREFEFSLNQIEGQWPGKMSEASRKKLKDHPDEKVKVIHVIKPRDSFTASSKKSDNLLFESIYIEKDTKHLLQETGFEELPFMAPRFWKTAREIYGRSPGSHSLPEVKMINAVKEADIKSRQLAIMPPLAVESGNVLSPVRLTPAGLTIIESGTKGIQPLNIGGNVNVANDMVIESRTTINTIFFADQLNLAQNPNMTATEVLQRTEDKLRLLGPVLGRTQTELLGPMIDRVFGLMFRGGAFLPPPEILSQGAEIRAEYVSPIARAQKQLEAQGILRMMDIMNIFLPTKPELMDNINQDKMFRDVGDLFGVPSDFFNSKDFVEQTREQRAEAIARQQQLDNQQQASEINKNVAG